MKKMTDYVCPKCGNDIGNEEIDLERDIDCVTFKMSCPECSATWREFFLLKYDGYAYDQKVYDADGEELI